MKDSRWIVCAASLSTTAGVLYVSCAIFDALFPPYGLIRSMARASPWPITGTITGFVTGFVMFVVAGFLLGALYGIARGFWSKRLK